MYKTVRTGACLDSKTNILSKVLDDLHRCIWLHQLNVVYEICFNSFKMKQSVADQIERKPQKLHLHSLTRKWWSRWKVLTYLNIFYKSFRLSKNYFYLETPIWFILVVQIMLINKSRTISVRHKFLFFN